MLILRNQISCTQVVSEPATRPGMTLAPEDRVSAVGGWGRLKEVTCFLTPNLPALPGDESRGRPHTTYEGHCSALHIWGNIELSCFGKRWIDFPSRDWFLFVHTSPGSEGWAFSKLGRASEGPPVRLDTPSLSATKNHVPVCPHPVHVSVSRKESVQAVWGY